VENNREQATIGKPLKHLGGFVFFVNGRLANSRPCGGRITLSFFELMLPCSCLSAERLKRRPEIEPWKTRYMPKGLFVRGEFSGNSRFDVHKKAMKVGTRIIHR